MLKLADLKKKRAAKVDSLAALFRSEQDETRSLSAEEQAALDTGEAEVRSLDQQIRVAELFAEAERRAVGAEALTGHQGMDLRRFSVARAIRGALTGHLDGLEAEFHAEASKGRETRGVMIPTELLLGETRAQTVSPTSAGGHLVGTTLQALADRPRPKLKVQGLGATVLSGLTGFVDLPNLSASGTTSWVAEGGAATRSSAAFTKVSMAPKTVTAEYELSRRLILQSNESVEGLMRNDLSQLLATALDAAAIKGGGTNEPVGIIANAGVNKVTLNGTWLDEITAQLIAAVAMDDWDGTGGFLTSVKMSEIAMRTFSSQRQPIPEADVFHGRPYAYSTLVPSNIGTTPFKSNLIYGLWSELFVGYWSAVDILVNPYHSDVASKGGALIHAFLDADVVVRRPSAFRYAEVPHTLLATV